MPPVTRKGDNCTGHDACPPRPSVEGEPTVSVSGREMMRVGHAYAAHGCPVHPPHGAVLAGGAAHASLTGIPIGRIGDPVSCGSAVAQGEASVTVGDQGGEDWGNSFALSLVQDPKDKLLLCLPEIAAAEAERTSGADRQGWLYLHEMLNKWFTRPANKDPRANPKPFWLDWEWVMSYPRARSAYTLFTSPKKPEGSVGDYQPSDSQNIYNAAARAMLASYLKDDGKFSEADENFDYDKLPWQRWRERYFNYRTVGRVPVADGLSAALASFTLRALARGQVTPNGRGGWEIRVTGAQVYVEDLFSFQAKDDFSYWSCERKQFVGPGIEGNPDEFHVGGSDFLRFQDRYGIGNDFLVLSPLHEVEGFQEICYDWP